MRHPNTYLQVLFALLALILVHTFDAGLQASAMADEAPAANPPAMTLERPSLTEATGLPLRDRAPGTEASSPLS